jgi:hypothetical protein
MELAHPDQAEIGEVRVTVGIPRGQADKLGRCSRQLKASSTNPSCTIASTSPELSRQNAASASTASQVRKGSVKRSATPTANE